MGLEITPKVGTPPSMESGFASLPPGSGLSDWIIVRDNDDGTIANALTLCSKGLSTGKLPNGRIDVSRIPLIGIAIDLTLGSLTNVSLVPSFSDSNNFNHFVGAGALSAGVVTLSRLSFLLSASNTLVFTIPNPGAPYMYLNISSTGVVTSSSCRLLVGGGWGSGNTMAGL